MAKKGPKQVPPASGTEMLREDTLDARWTTLWCLIAEGAIWRHSGTSQRFLKAGRLLSRATIYCACEASSEGADRAGRTTFGLTMLSESIGHTPTRSCRFCGQEGRPDNRYCELFRHSVLGFPNNGTGRRRA